MRQTGIGYVKEIKEIKQLWKVLKAPFELSANSRPSSSKGTLWTMDKAEEQQKEQVERKRQRKRQREREGRSHVVAVVKIINERNFTITTRDAQDCRRKWAVGDANSCGKSERKLKRE